jgi:cytoskeletal protein RodZ
MSFGEHLRKSREGRRISLAEAAAATKISSRYLQALEDEELEKLPGSVYNRGFLRSYAQFLGIESDNLVKDLDAKSAPPREIVDQPESKQPRRWSFKPRTTQG